MTAVTCHGITRQGERCRARPLGGSTYCVTHSPDVTDAQRKAWAAKGGVNSSAKARARKALPAELMTPDELSAWLGICFRRVIVGEMEPPVGTAAANLARTMMVIREATEVEARLEALERAAAAQGAEAQGATTGRRYSA